MEYSKEDLIEAKRQILGGRENMGTEESKKIWEENRSEERRVGKEGRSRWSPYH